MSITQASAPVRRSWGALAAWVMVCLLAGASGSAASRPGAWYAALDKPSWTPPSWLFGPVWTALYLTMGISAWLIWERRDREGARPALWLFGAQLALNALWSWLFFVWHRLDLAAAEIVLLWVAVAATLTAFRPICRAAALLLVPYLLWVSFAGALAMVLWRRNG